MARLQTQLHINCVGRVCVTVADTDRALDFYVDTLGFEKVVDVPMGPGMRWVEVQVGDAKTTIAFAPPPRARRRAAPRRASSSTRPTWTRITRPSRRQASTSTTR